MSAELEKSSKKADHQLFDAIVALEAEKGIPKDVIFEAIETALLTAYKKNYAPLMHVVVEMDRTDGQIYVYSEREVVDEVVIPQTEITYEDAVAIDPNCAIGDVIRIKEEPKDFGRIAAQTARQIVMQRLREAERGRLYQEFSSRESDLVSGQVDRIESYGAIVKLPKTEAVLGPHDQLPNEVYFPGKPVKAVISEVRRVGRGFGDHPPVIITRVSPGFLMRLFELEVPEIQDGFVEIKSVAREAGSRSKIAVHSKDEDIDAMGACVGPNGSRVRAIVDELSGEKIDVINWDESADIYIKEALSPSVVIDVLVDENEKKAIVVVPDDQLSLAIGKEGQNARLAAKLTGWKIDIKSKTQADEQGVDYNFIFVDEDEI